MSTTAFELTATMEDYLKAIFRLSLGQRVVRVRDIAKSVGVAPSTATGAVGTLRKRGLATHERYEDVVLTEEGERVAAGLCQRHSDLCRFLEQILLLDPEMAEDEACRMEHSISAFTLDRLRRFAATIQACSAGQPGCLRAFRDYLDTGELSSGRCPAAPGEQPESDG